MFQSSLPFLRHFLRPAAVSASIGFCAWFLLIGCDNGESPVAVEDQQGKRGDLFSTPPQPTSADFDSGVGIRPQRPNKTVLVPAGSFVMGDGVADCGINQRVVALTHGFYLGQYEVTNREYRDALQWAYDHGYVTADSATVSDNLDGSTEQLVDLDASNCQLSFEREFFHVAPGKDNHPVIEISWYGAVAYCDWISMRAGLTRAYNHSDWLCQGGDPYGASGYRLPTDAEWEYACQYNDGRIYPWGNEDPNCGLANFLGCLDVDSPRTVSVGSYPAAPSSLELYDMVGNVWEWCNDWMECDLGESAQTDPTGPTDGTARIYRGASWLNDNYPNLRCSYRRGSAPTSTTSAKGLRIARSL